MSYQAFQNESFLSKTIFTPYTISRNNDWFRFLSSGFIHANWPHLLFNMLALYSFGEILEKYYLPTDFGSSAKLIFLALYFAGMIVADIPTFLKYKNSPSYASLGASGAVSAIVFASILFNPLPEDGGIYLMFIPFPIPPVIFGILYLIYSAYMSKRGGDNINHDAHFYGAVFGFLFPVLLKPELLQIFIRIIQESLS
jgi:membrane associated rhomboid family serine protease